MLYELTKKTKIPAKNRLENASHFQANFPHSKNIALIIKSCNIPICNKYIV